MPGAMSAAQLLELNRPTVGRPLSIDEQKKFLLTSVAPAIIQPEEADRLIDYIVEETVLFQEATVDRMDTNEKDIRFLDISGSVLQQTTCGGTVTESVTISNTNKCLRTISVDAKFYLCDDDLEDGLTGAQLEQQVMRMTAETIANEMEFWALMANADASYSTDAASVLQMDNGVLHLRDGWYRQLQQGHPIDGQNVASDADNTLSFTKLNCLKTAIPTKFRRNPGALRIYMPLDMLERDFAALHQGRETNLGDQHYVGPIEAIHLLTPIVGVPLMPTDITNCGCASLVNGNGTFMFETEPNNMVVGIQRDVTFERERVAREHRTWFIWTVRFDALIFNEDQTSIVDCMSLSDCGTVTCSPTALANRCNACIDTGSGGEP